MKRIITFSLLLLLGISCMFARRKDNGPMKKESRFVPTFNGINATGAFDVILIPSDKAELLIEAPESLIQKINTEVKNGTLEISGKELWSDSSIRVTVRFTSLSGITCEGASDIRSLGTFKSDDFHITDNGAGSVSLDAEFGKVTLNLKGAGKVSLKGKAETLNADLNGASELDAASLEAVACYAVVNGASTANVHVVHVLHARAEGAGHLSYTGTPETKNVDAGGAGSIEQIHP